MDKEEFERRKRFAGTAKPSMKRRRVGHDYRSRCIYMVTLAVEGRRAMLGRLDGADYAATVVPSPLGEAVLEAWRAIPQFHPEVELPVVQLMPDHLHGIIFVTAGGGDHLGRIINGMKVACNRAYREMGMSSNVFPSLWEAGYNDLILEGNGMLNSMDRYVQDNPRRLWVKREHPELFSTRRNLSVNGVTFDAIGNHFLLEKPWRVQVKCHRRLTEQEIAREVERYMEFAERGAVLVSPAISAAEKAVSRAVFEARLPFVWISNNGFGDYSKPGGRMFEACAAGRLLMVTQWPHENREQALTRERCNAMNALAAALASLPPSAP